MDPLTLSLLSGLIPYGIDAITGASADKKKSLENQNQVMNQLIAQLQGNIGSSVTDSSSFKAGQGMLDKNYKKVSDRNIQDNAATGASSEQQLGNLAVANDGYQTGTLQNIQSAEAVRNSLMDKMNALKLGQAGTQVQQATNTMDNQNKLMSGFTSVIPSLIDGFGKKKNKYDPQTGKLIGGSDPETVN